MTGFLSQSLNVTDKLRRNLDSNMMLFTHLGDQPLGVCQYHHVLGSLKDENVLTPSDKHWNVTDVPEWPQVSHYYTGQWVNARVWVCVYGVCRYFIWHGIVEHSVEYRRSCWGERLHFALSTAGSHSKPWSLSCQAEHVSSGLFLTQHEKRYEQHQNTSEIQKV